MMFASWIAEKIAADLVAEGSAAAAAAAAAFASKAVAETVAVGTDTVDSAIAAVVGEQPAAFLAFVSGNQQTHFAY